MGDPDDFTYRPTLAQWAALRARSAKPSTRKRMTLPSRGSDGLFIRGPISVRWWAHVGKLGNRCSMVGMWLHHLAGLKRRQRDGGVEWSARAAERPIGIHHSDLSKALRRIEKAGYVTVRRAPGRKPLVTLQEVPSNCRCCLCVRGD